MLNLNGDEKNMILDCLSADPSRKALNLSKKIRNSMRVIKPRSAKNKGLEWQKEVCSEISRITGIEYDQTDDSCDIHSRESGLNGVDIILRGKARELFPYAVECKNCKSISLPEWVEQALQNEGEGQRWLLAIKSDRLPCRKVVVMSAD